MLRYSLRCPVSSHATSEVSLQVPQQHGDDNLDGGEETEEQQATQKAASSDNAKPLRNPLPPLPERPAAGKRKAANNKTSAAASSSKDSSKDNSKDVTSSRTRATTKTEAQPDSEPGQSGKTCCSMQHIHSLFTPILTHSCCMPCRFSVQWCFCKQG